MTTNTLPAAKVAGCLPRAQLLGAAIAGTALLLMQFFAAPAADRNMTCFQRWQACENRCFRNTADSISCINRTCNRQYDNCEIAAGKGKGKFSAIRQSAGEPPRHGSHDHAPGAGRRAGDTPRFGRGARSRGAL